MKRLLLLAALALLALSSCMFNLGKVSDADIQTAIAQTLAAAPTSTPTLPLPDTAVSVEPPTPTPSSTPFPATPSPIVETQPPAISQIDASVYALSQLENDQLLVTLQIPGGASGDYRATVNDQPFNCKVLVQYPDRLYCNGPTPGSGKFANLKLYREGSNQPVYEQQIGTPPIFGPTSPPAPKPGGGEITVPPAATESPTEPPATEPPYPYP